MFLLEKIKANTSQPRWRPGDQTKPGIEANGLNVATASYEELSAGSKRRKSSTEVLRPQNETISKVANFFSEVLKQIDVTKEEAKSLSMNTTEPVSSKYSSRSRCNLQLADVVKGPECQNAAGLHERSTPATLPTVNQSASTIAADKPNLVEEERQKTKIAKLGEHEKPQSKRRAKSTPDQAPPQISAVIADEWLKMTGQP